MHSFAILEGDYSNAASTEFGHGAKITPSPVRLQLNAIGVSHDIFTYRVRHFGSLPTLDIDAKIIGRLQTASGARRCSGQSRREVDLSSGTLHLSAHKTQERSRTQPRSSHSEDVGFQVINIFISGGRIDAEYRGEFG